MRKLLSAFTAVFICVIVLAVPVSAYSKGSTGIDDRAGLFSESEKKQLEEKQKKVAELTGWNIAVITTDTGFGSLSRTIDFAEKYYDDTFGSSSSSVVYLIDLDYRHVSMDGEVLEYFSDSRIDVMLDACEERYQAYDDVGNLEKFYYYLEYYYNKGKAPPIELKFNYLTGIIAAAIAVVIVVSSYKFHHAAPPNIYLNGNSIRMYNSRDTFIREFTTRTRISDESSGGRGGGGHRSSGGHSHGGGSRGGRR